MLHGQACRMSRVLESIGLVGIHCRRHWYSGGTYQMGWVLTGYTNEGEVLRFATVDEVYAWAYGNDMEEITVQPGIEAG